MAEPDGYQTPYNPQAARDEAPRDTFGNAEGSQYDLAKDDAFQGLEILIVQLYTYLFDFAAPQSALEAKGFRVRRITSVPSPDEFGAMLSRACQVWLISDSSARLGEEHLEQLEEFFVSGRGVYIWGDNAPYFADANALASRLLGVTLSGDDPGDTVLTARGDQGGPGFDPAQPVCAGIDHLFEGVTIAGLSASQDTDTVAVSSTGQVLVGAYDRAGRRALVDGGFTRLYVDWDSAGTGRYVKNAAAWLVNFERFGQGIYSARDVESRLPEPPAIEMGGTLTSGTPPAAAQSVPDVADVELTSTFGRAGLRQRPPAGAVRIEGTLASDRDGDDND